MVRGEQQHRPARQRPAGRAVRRPAGQLRVRQLRPGLHRRRTRSSAASTASRSTTSATRTTRCCAARSCARVGRATPPSTALEHGDLLFMSVEETRGRIDCGTQGAAPGAVNPERFRGVRIFDISDIDNPVQLPGVQTCRGSHTHTLVTDPGRPGQHLRLQLGHRWRAVAVGAGWRARTPLSPRTR